MHSLSSFPLRPQVASVQMMSRVLYFVACLAMLLAGGVEAFMSAPALGVRAAPDPPTRCSGTTTGSLTARAAAQWSSGGDRDMCLVLWKIPLLCVLLRNAENAERLGVLSHICSRSTAYQQHRTGSLMGCCDLNTACLLIWCSFAVSLDRALRLPDEWLPPACRWLTTLTPRAPRR